VKRVSAADQAAELPFLCVANDVIRLKFVLDENEIYDDSTSFHPALTHQIFEDEIIRGIFFSDERLHKILGNFSLNYLLL
jgi:hypothetical protein